MHVSLQGQFHTYPLLPTFTRSALQRPWLPGQRLDQVPGVQLPAVIVTCERTVYNQASEGVQKPGRTAMLRWSDRVVWLWVLVLQGSGMALNPPREKVEPP